MKLLLDMFCSQGTCNKDEDGFWYRKSDTPQEETFGSQKGKRTHKNEEKGRSNTEEQALT